MILQETLFNWKGVAGIKSWKTNHMQLEYESSFFQLIPGIKVSGRQSTCTISYVIPVICSQSELKEFHCSG